MNLINWIGIMFSALFFGVAKKLLETFDVPLSWIFLLLALALLPVAIFYRPRVDG